jgi:hypothetical protein
MKYIKSLGLVALALSLAACGEPKDEAIEIAQQACIADKNSDIGILRDLMDDDIFETNKAMHQNSDPLMKNILKMLNCDLKSIEKLDDGGFVVNFKKHNSYVIKEVNGDFKIVDEQYF